MKKVILFVVPLLLLFQLSFSQIVIQGKPVSLKNHSEKVQSLLRHYQIYDIDIPKINHAVRNESNGMEVQLILHDTHLNLTVFPNLIRATDYKHAKNGKVYPVDSTVEKCITYKGFVNGNKKATLRLTITNTMFEGYITYNGEILYITQLNDLGFRKAGMEDNIIVYRKKDVKRKGGYCGVTTSQEARYLASRIREKVTNAPLSENCRTVEIATDADYEWHQRFGNIANNEILSILNSVEGVYQNDFNLNIVVTYQNVWTSSNDPFTGNPLTPSGAETLLNEFRNYWENNMQSVDRDLAHLFVGKHYDYSGGGSVVVGIAYEGVVCAQPDHSYGFTKGRLNCFLTTTHEIGHNFGGLHSDGENCHTYNASIMCQGLKSIPMYFSNASITRISNFMNAHSSCLSPLIHSISGPNMICNSGTYSLVGDIPIGSSVTWSASPNGIVNLTPNGKQVTVTRISNGTITLNAAIDNSCVSPAQRNIQVLGTPSLSQISIEKNGPSCILGQSLSFGVVFNGHERCYLENDGITEVDWQIYSPNPYQVTYNSGYYGCSSSSVINPGLELDFSPPLHPFMVTLRARVKNKCGKWSHWTPGFAFLVKSCNYSPLTFSLYPNPASTTIHITVETTDESKFKNEDTRNRGFIKEIKIYTSTGKLVKQHLFNGNSLRVQMDISTLESGIYFVEISAGHYIGTQKLIIHKNSLYQK